MLAQSYNFRHYQVENGLSNNATICSLQDTKGFLWFGTKDGLNRFDGYTFKIFRHSPADSGSIGSNFIHYLYEDALGIVWVGTVNGLYKYNHITESFSLLKAGGYESIRDIKMDKNHNLWFIHGFTLCRWNEKNKTLVNFDISRYFDATSISIGPDESIWVSTTLGLLKKFHPESNSFDTYDVFLHSDNTVSKWIEKIYAITGGKLLVGTSNQGVKLFDFTSNTYKDILTYNANKTPIFTRNFIQTTADECWIATESGIYIYNLIDGKIINLQKKYNDPYSVSDNAVYCFVKDKEGGIWAGTYFGGVNYYPKPHTAFKKQFPKAGENSLSGNVVREIHEDKFGNLWVGTEDAGLNKYDTTTKQFTHYQPSGNKKSVSSTNIHGMLVNEDELWIGTFENGLDVLNIKSNEVTRHYGVGTGEHSLKSNFIYTISKTADGEIMLGTTQGAYFFNRKTNDFSLLPGMGLYTWYTGILKDQNGTVWATTFGNGVVYHNLGTGKGGNFRYDVANKNSLSSDRVNSIFQDYKKTLWFATEGGLCRLLDNKKTFKRYTTENGFPSNFILSMLEDAHHLLWISTSKGLVCFNPDTEQIVTYTLINGILNDQFNYNSAFKDQQGKMYFGSVKGMISFDPYDFVKDTFVPPVYITGFQIFNNEQSIAKNGSPLTKSIINTSSMVLSYKQSTFSIDFASLSYTSPEMSEYAYKMEGLDNDWIYLKTNRKVYFTDLSAGNYTFKVKAANSSGIWNTGETNLNIRVLPPWWFSSWAYLLYSMLGILLLFLIAHSYHKRAEEKNKRTIQLLESTKEKEIFEAKIEFFTNVAHEIRTPLTLIKGPLEKVIRYTTDLPVIKESLKIMERNTNRLIDLSNQLLDFRQTEIKGFSLHCVPTDITGILEETFLNFRPLAEQSNLSFRIKLPAERIWASVDVEAFTKILTNLFSNAIKYAGSKVAVNLLPLNADAKHFVIEIKNDGYLIPYDLKEKIFEPFFRLKETEKQKGTGIGLALSRSLTQLHNGTLEIKENKQELNMFYLSLPVKQD